ncbi:MAG: toxin-antitoxin system YwqK family antitoxin [Phreatobacter sp.]|uniref:toxin-antitoxin system YwqK family antitoxin n=1 Tax=Phreatobacter sp. TaxID=1966341 RepID=UPI0040359DE1
MSDRTQPFEKRHRDGSLWARGQTAGGEPTGYWEWFRKDGTKLRSGSFDKGVQVGEWTTYDASGHAHRTTWFVAGKRRTTRPD